MRRLAGNFQRSVVNVAFTVTITVTLLAVSSPAALAQAPPSWSPGDVPRFLLVPADSTQTPAVIDPADVPMLRRRIAVHVSGVTRREALRQIARASGLEFVYANDLVPPGDSVRLQADDITVAAALTEVLLGAGVDIAIGSDGNAILVRRAVLLPPAPRKDVVRGRVTTDSGTAIAGADAIVTIAPSVETFRTLTDSTGNYSITITDGSGEYLLFVGAPGRKSFRQRLTRVGGDTTFVVNVKLASNVTTTMATVRVQARRPRPTRSLGAEGTAGTDGTDRTVDGVYGALPPDLQGNLDAMAQLVPGLTVGAGGATAFGLGAGDNKTMLNGLSFGAADLPRDAVTKSRYTTSAWDPSVGGFSGFQNSVTLGRGNDISQKTGHFNLDHPALQFSDPAAARLGAEFTNIDVGVGGTGPIALEKYYYSYGAQLRRNSSDVSSLADLDLQALSVAGVSPDSAARLLQMLSSLHVPATMGGIPTARITTTGSFIERVDRVTPVVVPGAVPGPSSYLMAYGRYSESDAQTLSSLAPPTYAGKSTRADFTLQGFYSKYLGTTGNYLNETTSSISFSESRGTPYLELPGGNVLIASALPDGTDALGALSFGGNSALATDTRRWNWEVVNQTNFLINGLETMPFRIYLQSLFSGFSQSLAANRLGTFTYPSLSAITNGSPSSFSRSLNVPNPSGGEWIGAGSAGGSWKKGTFTLMGGARIDANVFTSAPQENSQLASAFGVRNDYEPNSVDVSPRLGFVWGGTRSGYQVTQASLLNFGDMQFRGGIGKYRSSLSPMALENAMVSTGLPNSEQTLLCTGPATPVPNWQAYASDPSSIPSSCAGTSTFADTAPTVRFFSRSYTPAQSWRATLGFTKRIKNVYLSVDGSYSINLNQPGTLDLNFAGLPRFSLANESNRPVFVSPSSIYPGTGTLSAVQSRSHGAFGPALESVSDLRGDSRQVTVYAIPSIPFSIGQVTVAYTYFDTHSQARGFDQSTAGDPRAIEWASVAPHHQVIIQAAHFFKKVVVTTFVRATSGFPFTPLVAGDINGDGSSNDRAFIFNPATVVDPALATGLRALMTSGPTAARNCLNGQIGQIAGRGSCTGPWSATMNAYVYFSQALPHTDKRAHLTVNFTNVLGGFDELLHGGSHLQGWGGPAFPDPTLYRVTGFDPVAQRFSYAVNPRFGSSSPATTTMRIPFRMTLGVSLDLGHSYEEQQLALNLRVRPSLAGTRASVDSIKARFYRCCEWTDVYLLLTRMSDSLALSRDQITAMQQQRVVMLAREDSIYAALANYLVTVPNDYDNKEVLKHVKAANDAALEVVFDQRTFLAKLLTKGQIRLLPSPLYRMVTDPTFKGRFYYSP
jgi:hypothetical protein